MSARPASRPARTLHFEVHRNGVPVNPLGATFANRAQLSGADLASFRNRLHGLLATPTGATRTAARPGAGPTRNAR